MSQETNVDAVKRAYAAMERGDIPALLELCDPEMEFDNSDAVFDAALTRDTANAMSEENVELARRCLEAFNEGGLPAAESFLDPEIVFDQSRSPFPDAGVYHGIEGVREWFDGLADAFGDVHYEIEQVRDLGEKVAVMVRVRGRGPGSGIEVEYRFVPLLAFREGKILRMDRFTEWEEALAAAGLSA
jgi:ketosteroid isomerase-like protein